jgi:hypothetical protein
MDLIVISIFFGSGFGWREEDQEGEFFGDVIETVPDLGGNEDHASSGDLSIFGSSLEARASANYVVDFIFAMRLLVVDCASGQNV